MSDSLQLGRYVSVHNPLSAFIPGAKPRDYGVITRIDDGDYFVTFAIGNDDPREHSQCAPYSADELQSATKEEALANLPPVWGNIDPASLVEPPAPLPTEGEAR